MGLKGTKFLAVENIYLKPGLVPDGPIIEGPGRSVEEHDGDEGVQNNGENQGYEVEQSDVCEEHCNVHLGGSGVFEITLGNLNRRDREKDKNSSKVRGAQQLSLLVCSQFIIKEDWYLLTPLLHSNTTWP